MHAMSKGSNSDRNGTLHASFEVPGGAAVPVILDVSKGHGAFIL